MSCVQTNGVTELQHIQWIWQIGMNKSSMHRPRSRPQQSIKQKEEEMWRGRGISKAMAGGIMKEAGPMRSGPWGRWHKEGGWTNEEGGQGEEAGCMSQDQLQTHGHQVRREYIYMYGTLLQILNLWKWAIQNKLNWIELKAQRLPGSSRVSNKQWSAVHAFISRERRGEGCSVYPKTSPASYKPIAASQGAGPGEPESAL